MTPGFASRLSGIEFTGRSFRWEPGVYVTDVDGLVSGGEVTSETIARGFGVGSYDTANRRDGPRIITQSGFIYARSWWELGARMDQVAQLLAEDDDAGMYVWTEYGNTRHASVRRHRTTSLRRRRGSDPFADYTLSLRAPDQRIYGETETTPWAPTVSVVHRGGYPAPAVVEVRGSSGGGYTITGPRGKLAVVTRPIAPGANHTYDGDTGLLTVGGAAQVTGVGRSDQLEIPYGAHQFTVNNGCELRVTFAPTWAP